MKSKFWAIAKRECVLRMKKTSFWVLSLMGPVILVLMSVVPYAITSSLQEKKEMLINMPQYMAQEFPLSVANYEVHAVDTSSQEAVGLFLSGTENVLCDLHTGKDTQWTIYTKEALHPADSLNIIRSLKSPAHLMMPSRVVNFKQENNEGLAFSALQQTMVLLAAILVYFFLFTYSVSLLKGVMEEKSNKVMDVILSSISPATWIMGKIAGVGLASFVQFLLWMGISYVPFYFFKQKYGTALDTFSSANIHTSLHDMNQAEAVQALGWYDWLTTMSNVHWLTLCFTMVVAMVLGFILYAAVFAIIGMISGRESDAQPYVLPVTSPLIFSFITSGAVIADPYGSLSQVLSAIPFTAPVVLTLRAGLGVPFSDLWLSFLTLGLISAALVLLAGKVYKRLLNKGGRLF